MITRLRGKTRLAKFPRPTSRPPVRRPRVSPSESESWYLESEGRFFRLYEATHIMSALRLRTYALIVFGQSAEQEELFSEN